MACGWCCGGVGWGWPWIFPCASRLWGFERFSISLVHWSCRKSGCCNQPASGTVPNPNNTQPAHTSAVHAAWRTAARCPWPRRRRCIAHFPPRQSVAAAAPSVPFIAPGCKGLSLPLLVPIHQVPITQPACWGKASDMIMMEEPWPGSPDEIII